MTKSDPTEPRGFRWQGRDNQLYYCADWAMIKAARRGNAYGFRNPLTLCVLTFAVATVVASPSGSAPGSAAPGSTPRELFNAGTQTLRAGKLGEAEAFLEKALASQNQRLQSPGLY